MITLIYGDDKYQAEKQLANLKQTFTSNDFNVSIFDDELDFARIKTDAETLPFLAEKKLVIVKGLSKTKDKKNQTEIAGWLKDIPNHLELIFFEEELTPKNWLFLALKNQAKIESYTKLRPYEISHWIKENVAGKGGSIDPIASEKLAAMIGNDLWRLDNEIQKLITYNKQITVSSIEKLVEGEFLDSIFNLMDAISEKKEQKALIILNKFMQDEENAVYLLTMLARQARNLLSIKDLSEKGDNENSITNKIKLHPYVVKNTLRQSKNFTKKELLDFHERLVETDYQLKTTSADSKIILVKLVHRLCQN